ncbi:MAG: hypothetical protein AAF958_01685, partial [Planctomycetota bacterium]
MAEERSEQNVGERVGVAWRTEWRLGKLEKIWIEKAVAVWYRNSGTKQKTNPKATAMEVSQTNPCEKTAVQRRCENLRRRNQRLLRKLDRQ